MQRHKRQSNEHGVIRGLIISQPAPPATTHTHTQRKTIVEILCVVLIVSVCIHPLAVHFSHLPQKLGKASLFLQQLSTTMQFKMFRMRQKGSKEKIKKETGQN